MRLEELKQGLSSFWDSVAEGWQHLRQSASGALTRFKPGEHTNLPAKDEVDDEFYLPSMSWSMLGNDLFEDDKRLVVRLEIPGMDKNDLDVEVLGDTLVVHGQKRFEREGTEGRYRMLQCAYGSFRRVIQLPVPVLSDKASATYKDGVLRVELPKAEPDKPHRASVKVA